MTIDPELEGRRALITGAGQGVGEAIARTLAAAGTEVLVNDYVGERADAVTRDIVADGGKATAVPFDVTDHQHACDALESQGPVDILVNNAGNAGSGSFDVSTTFVGTTPTEWSRFIDVNLYGVMNCVHAALPRMIEAGWGRIVTIVSDAARTGGSRMAAYSAAKAGAAGFTRCIADEVARHGITVNNLALGTMRTPISAGFWNDPSKADEQRAMMADYLIRRPGEPDDVAWMVTMLASPRSSWVTGQTIPVNGGFSFAL